MAVTIAKAITGPNEGIVTLKNFLHPLAPSNDAASYCDLPIPEKAVLNVIIPAEIPDQTELIIITHIAS